MIPMNLQIPRKVKSLNEQLVVGKVGALLF